MLKKLMTRIKITIPIVATILAIAGGLFDGFSVLSSSPHLFSGLLDQAAFLGFAIGFYFIAGALVSIPVALVPPKLFFIRDEMDERHWAAFVLAFLIGLGLLVIVVVENVNFFYFTLDTGNNIALIAGSLIGSYVIIRLLYLAFSKSKGFSGFMSSLVNLWGSKLRLLGFTAIFAICAFQVIRVPASAEMSTSPKPNIILISFDTLGAQHMSSYGYDKETSPHLDKVAAEGALFLNHFSVSRSTLPSHMSMLTSLYPTVHKVTDSFTSVLEDNFTTLAEVVTKFGYETGAFVDGNRKLNIGAAHGFDQGFDFYEHLPQRFVSYEKLYLAKRFLNFFGNFMHPRGIPDMHSDNIFGGAISWLSKRRGEKPFFLFLHTYDIHSDFGTKLPYIAPKEFRRLQYTDYRGDFTGCGSSGVCATDYLGKINKRIRRGTHQPEDLLSQEDVKLIRSLYDCGIEYTDYEFGRFYDALEKRNLLDNSILVLTSDHGEEFFQHDLLKHNQYYDEIMHVPLIVRYPKKLAAGTRVEDLSRSVDILPTILDLADIEFESQQFQGSSLAPYATGDSLAEELVLFAGEDRPVDITTKVLRTSRYKYIEVGGERQNQKFYEGKQQQLYDLIDDPMELSNLATIQDSLTADFREQVQDWKARCEALRLVMVPKELTKSLKLDKKTIKELESLGYIK